MNLFTRVFLVLLRLAIGWHFFFEGLEKIESVRLGPTTTNRPWTSEPYLREATGPLGDVFRRQIGDLDDMALAKLTVEPLPPGQDPAHTPLSERFPPALAQAWQDYLSSFVSHYQLTQATNPDEQKTKQRQVEAAKQKLEQHMDQTVRWLLEGSKQVNKTFPSGTVEVKRTTPARVEEYSQQVERMRAMEREDLPAFGRDVRKDQLRAVKDEVKRLRSDLLRDLDVQTAQMKDALQEVLTKEQKALGPVPAPSASREVDRIDWITRWGLTIIGAGLLLGLFTRLACMGGAGFLLLFYLTMPPFPWVPENLRVEGHYLFVNKNLIEMLALLCLATTRSGCWAGLDGLLQFVKPWRWRLDSPGSEPRPSGSGRRQSGPPRGGSDGG
jgi:uncharacterized membrane protein YphA (DoxX/SURF4 family)